MATQRNARITMLLFWTIAIATIALPAASFQGRREQPHERTALFANAAMPSEVRQPIAALGERVQRTGKEVTTWTGEFTDANGTRSTVELIHQLPGLVRLQAANSRVLVFDGNSRRGSGGFVTNDEDLLESIVLDSAEGMLWSLQEGGSMRLLGLRFGPDPKRLPDYNGPRYDIYEITGETHTRQDRLRRTKRYYFDSNTGLLVRTRYRDSRRSVDVETRFSRWATVDGSAYPGSIERYEAGRLVFAFHATNVSHSPKRDVNVFRIP
ncbi:MAG: hypothetical protein HY646_03010 [Acidobacteria bacterium]|nr:hypothetical protein [Acidobacteriota bacterium]